MRSWGLLLLLLLLDLDLDQHSFSGVLFHLKILEISLTDQDFQFFIVNHEETQTFADVLSLCIQKQISMYHRPDSGFNRKSQTLFKPYFNVLKPVPIKTEMV